MQQHFMNIRLSLLIAILSLAACTRSESPPAADMIVYKSPTCGCCRLWVQHVANAGFTVEIRDMGNVNPEKDRLGVPEGRRSCHTAQIGDYFIEGHVPVEDIKRLLKEQPKAKGITVPNMPMGSPGMESPSGKVTPYDVLLVGNDGTATVFAHHN